MKSDDFASAREPLVTNIELEGRRLLDGYGLDKELAAGLNNDALLNAIYTQTGHTILKIADKLRKATDPEAAFAETFDALDELEKQRFVTQNALEALKRGEKTATILERYQTIGLIAPPPVSAAPSQVAAKSKAHEAHDPPPFVPTYAPALQWIEGKMRDASLWILELMETSLGFLMDHAEVEFGIDLKFPLPTPTLTFKVAGKAREILQLLRRNGARAVV